MSQEPLLSPEEADQPLLQCEVCLKELPSSEAISAEGRDYVLHFCGADCYQQWREGEEA